MTTSGAHPYHPNRKLCVDCGRVYYSWGAHAEECAGPPPDDLSVVSCECPDGFMHLPTCYLVTGDEA